MYDTGKKKEVCKVAPKAGKVIGWAGHTVPTASTAQGILGKTLKGEWVGMLPS